MANVTVTEKAMTDGRIKLLGRLLGTSRFDARGRMIEVWNQCTEQNVYQLSADVIDALAEIDGFADLMIKVELGAREEDGRIRVKGTEGRIEWLDESRGSAPAGGKARAQSAKRDDKGRFLPSEGEQSPAGWTSAGLPLDPPLDSGLDPAGSSAIQPSIPIHSNSIQSNTEQKDEEEGSAPETSGAPPPIETVLPEFSNPPDIAQTLFGRRVSLDVQRAWLNAYPDVPWIQHEIRKAIAWEKVNPSRKKRHFARFMGRWLSRGWDSRRAPPGGMGRAELRSQANRNALETYLGSLGEGP